MFTFSVETFISKLARSLEQKRNANLADDSASVFVTSSVRYFIEGHSYKYAGKSSFTPEVACQPEDNKEWVVFIDTNRSFSVYTEITLLAAQRLIIPVNADDFSREALESLLHSVYGIAKADHRLPDDFQLYDQKLTFGSKARKNGLRRPMIYLLIHNRAARYNLRSAEAFRQLATRSFAALKRAFNNNRQVFQLNLRLINAEQYFADIGDFHTAGIVALHYGCPLAKLKDIYSSLTQIPFVHGTVALNSQQIDIHLQCLRNLAAKL